MDTRTNTRISEELKSDITHVQTQDLLFDVTRRPSEKTAVALREAQEIIKNHTTFFDSMD